MKKNVMHISMTGLLLALLLPLQVFAEGSGDGFRLDQSGTVTLDSSHAAKEGISSCRFSLTVEPESGSHVEFAFAGDLAEIMEYRYNADEKKLNIYMAGTDPLFPTGTESLAIGKVVVTDGSGNSGKATVSVEEGSLQFVYGSEARTMEDVDIPEAVMLGQTGSSGTTDPMNPMNPMNPITTPIPVETPGPPAPSSPSNPAGSAPGGSQPNGTQTAGGQGGSGQNSSAPGRKPGGTQVGSNQGTGGGQGSSNQGTGNDQGAGNSQESSSTQEPEPENSAQPSESPSEPVESSEEELGSAGAESGEEEENLSKGEGGFWKELKPVLTGLGIGALLLGVGALVVMLLIKAPKHK